MQERLKVEARTNATAVPTVMLGCGLDGRDDGTHSLLPLPWEQSRGDSNAGAPHNCVLSEHEAEPLQNITSHQVLTKLVQAPAAASQELILTVVMAELLWLSEDPQATR